MKKIKLLTIVGTRPEIIRLSRIIYELERNTQHYLVHTGQNYDYELNQIFFEELNLKKPDYFLNSANNASSACETIGKIIISVDKIIDSIKPEAVLILGDTNSCLSAIPAKRRKIPIFHIEAGNRAFDLRIPEEINRKIVDHISDINLTYSSISRDYLLREGISPQNIIKIGSPMLEVINFYRDKINNSNILQKFSLKKNNYFLVSCHREENINDDINFSGFINTLESLAKDYGLPILVSTHPRTKKQIDEKNIKLNKLVNLIKPLGFFDYIFLQMNAKVVLSDSGTISEESSILNFPAINIRENHERPEAMEEASLIMTGFNYERISQSINLLENQKKDSLKFRVVFDYNINNVSKKVVRIIHSYLDYVNKNTWYK